jgi:SH3-like domain-containing protein
MARHLIPMPRIRSQARTALLIVAAATAAVAGSFVSATPAAAAGPKVVIVVGPTNGATATYLSRAKTIAAEARSLGASVTEIYTPRATWARVSAAAQGAKLFVYLGHGSGYPSAYGDNPLSANGMGLNPTLDSGTNSPVKYYGESLIASTIHFGARAVVLLNHLCYASGSAEPGMAQPSWTVAHERVDNYAQGFLKAGAGAVIADAYTDVSYEVRAVLTGRNVLNAWRADPNYNDHERSFASDRSGYRNYLDPDRSSSYFYRAVTTTTGFTTATPAAYHAKTTTAVKLRTKPSESASVVATLPGATGLAVTGHLVRDSKGRTWAPVKTSSGKKGYVAAWLLRFSGTATTTTSVVLRKSASLTGARIKTLPSGTHVTVTGSKKDGAYRVWLSVRTSSGTTGWIAAWLTRP